MFVRPDRSRRKLKADGFSLVELLIVTALIPIVAMTLYSTFSASVSLWKALNRQIPEEDTAIFFIRSQQDFNQSFRYALVPFYGTSEEISFASAIDTVPELGGSRGIGSVRYFYDPAKRSIVREERNISQIYQDKGSNLKVVLQNVDSFSIGYFVRDESYKVFKWKEDWVTTEKDLPVAVRFDFERNENDNIKNYSKIFYIPTGGVA